MVVIVLGSERKDSYRDKILEGIDCQRNEFILFGDCKRIITDAPDPEEIYQRVYVGDEIPECVKPHVMPGVILGHYLQAIPDASEKNQPITANG